MNLNTRLWCLLIGRYDLDRSNTYSIFERRELIFDIFRRDDSRELYENSIFQIKKPRRTTLQPEILSSHFEEPGFGEPQATKIRHSSLNGYPSYGLDQSFCKETWIDFTRKDSKPLCALDIHYCFGKEFFNDENPIEYNTVDLFRTLTFTKPECGDALMYITIGNSGVQGLKSFLTPAPPPMKRIPPLTPARAPIFGLKSNDWRNVDYDWKTVERQLRYFENFRDWSIRIIARYSYLIGKWISII